MKTLLLHLTVLQTFVFVCYAFARHEGHLYSHYQNNESPSDLSIWINEQQVKVLSGYSFRIFAIENGRVSPQIKDPQFDSYLPIIPSEVNSVNFTWTAGHKKYKYNFDLLQSNDENILKAPTISIKTKGKIPQQPKQFSVFLPCSNLTSGIAKFSLGLLITSRKGKLLPGTPLRFSLRKECVIRGMNSSLDYSPHSQGPKPVCDKKCENNGRCMENNGCKCTEGYLGEYCEQALCFPQCMNGGNCTAPAVCSCPKGYQGPYCEGGICTDKCLNGGKCVQKDKCDCPKGYYGLRCEFSKCVIPCMNGGKCKGDNKCRCPHGLGGDHCEIGRRQRSTCKKPCKNGKCLENHTCSCDKGYFGKFCNRKREHHKKQNTLPRR